MAAPTTSVRDLARDCFSATIGSVACTYVGQPFDTIKVRLQSNPEIFTSPLQASAKTFRSEGLAAFWKGAIPTAAGMVAENVMAFGVNAQLKRTFPDPERTPGSAPDLVRPFIMGTLTGFCSALVLIPSEIIKAKTQVELSNVSSSQIFRRMMKEQGVRSMFVGLDGQFMRDGPFYAVFFGGYELSCYAIRETFPSVPEDLNYFVSGGLAGMLGWLCAMPFDVPKTNVQSRWDTKVVGSYFPELAKIARNRGIAGLYSGLTPTLVRAFPANAALFLGVEKSKLFFDSWL